MESIPVVPFKKSMNPEAHVEIQLALFRAGSVNGAPSTVKFGAVTKSSSYKLVLSWSFLLCLRKLYSAKKCKIPKVRIHAISV